MSSGPWSRSPKSDPGPAPAGGPTGRDPITSPAGPAAGPLTQVGPAAGLTTHSAGQSAHAGPSRGMDDPAALRRFLSYAVAHADTATRHNREVFAILAADPTIGADHPAYVAIYANHPIGWSLSAEVVEMALGRRLEAGESPADGLAKILRMVREGRR
jgi:hypothetical protein